MNSAIVIELITKKVVIRMLIIKTVICDDIPKEMEQISNALDSSVFLYCFSGLLFEKMLFVYHPFLPVFGY